MKKNRIIIEKSTGNDVFAELKSEWQKLFSAANNAPFLAWEWLSVWHKWFGEGKSPFILTARRGNELIGILPLYRSRQKFFGFEFGEKLGFLGDANGGADYLDLIAETENKLEIWSAIYDFLRYEESIDFINLESLASDCEIARFLQSKDSPEDQNFYYSERNGEVCPQICLTDGWESVLEQSKRGGSFTRLLKKLQKMPDFEFRIVEEPCEIRAAFERFYQLHEKRWANSGGSELSGNFQSVEFQRKLVYSLATAKLIRFSELWVDGKCLASTYCLRHGETFYYYNGGYDLNWAKFSIGFVSVGLTIRAAAEEGFAVFDFLRGDEKYKFEWTNDVKQLVSVNLAKSNLTSFIFQKSLDARQSLRSAAKIVLPGKIHENLRNFQRSLKRGFQVLICGGNIFWEETFCPLILAVTNSACASHLAEAGSYL